MRGSTGVGGRGRANQAAHAASMSSSVGILQASLAGRATLFRKVESMKVVASMGNGTTDFKALNNLD
jgi:hypothetical protein